MIYITGDLHAEIDIGKLSNKNFPTGKSLTKNDYVIICGDFGLVWNDCKVEQYWRNWLNSKPWTTLFVSGNHENFDKLEQYPVTIWHGGKVQFIENSIIHLMRGQIFNIDGFKLFTMGGASSHDKEFRIEKINWWPQELPSNEEYNEAIKNLQAANNRVDFIITHCVSDFTMNQMASWYERDKLTNFFEQVIEKDVQYKHWFFGHYHRDEQIDLKHTCLYNKIKCLNDFI